MPLRQQASTPSPDICSRNVVVKKRHRRACEQPQAMLGVSSKSKVTAASAIRPGGRTVYLAQHDRAEVLHLQLVVPETRGQEADHDGRMTLQRVSVCRLCLCPDFVRGIAHRVHQLFKHSGVARCQALKRLAVHGCEIRATGATERCLSQRLGLM